MLGTALSYAHLPYAHLLRLSDDIGVVEHARGLDALTSTGYCVDDVARALVVVARDEALPESMRSYEQQLQDFVVSAVTPDGRTHNRRPYASLAWSDQPSCGDWWGRALWALGTVVACGRDADGRVLQAVDRALARRSPHLRAMAYAGLGAGEVLRRHPDHPAARALLEDAVREVDAASDLGRPWPWPEPRLRYANAVLPEVLVVGGARLGDERLLGRGVALLEWLLQVETAPAGHLSVTPVAGWAIGEPRPGFDQQPIEVAALAEACFQAFAATGDERWRDAVTLAQEWFDGRNDVGVVVAADDGGGYDGLTPTGVNVNQGAESTLALLEVRQLARRATPTERSVEDEESRSA